MTELSGNEIAARVEKQLPGSVAEATDKYLIVKKESLLPVATFLKTTPELDFDYLNSITAIDYHNFFEIVYNLTSLNHNHSLVLKTRCEGHDNPAVPSVTSLWQGADLQEREAYDLMGIRFEGHPNLKRIFLWEGFSGHPLRKDWAG